MPLATSTPQQPNAPPPRLQTALTLPNAFCGSLMVWDA